MYEQTQKAMFNLAASAVIFDSEKRVLLAHRTDMDLWNLPGGGVELGETPWEAVVREVKEEIGVDAEVERLAGIYFRKENTLVFSFICKIIGGTLILSDEASAIEYFSFENFPHNVSPSMLVRVHDALTREGEVVQAVPDVPSVHALLKNEGLDLYIRDLKRKLTE